MLLIDVETILVNQETDINTESNYLQGYSICLLEPQDTEVGSILVATITTNTKIQITEPVGWTLIQELYSDSAVGS